MQLEFLWRDIIPEVPQLGFAEEVAVDGQGNVFASFTNVKVLQLENYIEGGKATPRVS
jgi:hypothetical protein